MPDIQEDNIKNLINFHMTASGTKSVLVNEVNCTRLCAYCNLDLNIEEGVMIYDKNWFHNDCWGFFENQKEVSRND